MARSVAVFIAALIAGTTGASSAPAAHASCAGPRITLTPNVVRPGSEVTVTGEYFGTDCNDTGGDGPVLGAPAAGIRLILVKGTQKRVLARVDASKDYVFTQRVLVPTDVSGMVSVHAETGGMSPATEAVALTVQGEAVSAPTTPPVTATASSAPEQPSRPDAADASAPIWAWAAGALVLLGVGIARFKQRHKHSR